MDRRINDHAPWTSRLAMAWLLAVLARHVAPGAEPLASIGFMVEVAEKPDRPFVDRPTIALDDLPPLPPDPKPNRFGGESKPLLAATGFFRAEELDGRWWLIDPEGGRFICRGVNTVAPVPSAGGCRAAEERFGTEADWARATTVWLREAGFNAVGAWSDDRLREVEQPLPSTRIWNFMSAYGKRRGGTFAEPGHTGYPGGCPFVFDPEFPAFCDEHARQLAAVKDDPWLIGHFTDNELPWKRSLLEAYLALGPSDHGHRAARGWLAARQPAGFDPQAITEQDRADFLEFAIDRYLGTVTAAIRNHDPNHLVLGMRLHGSALRLPEVWRACGRHCDVVSVNYYHAWTPNPERMAMWVAEAGRPFLVTEFYAKGADSGLGNSSGAGWLVKTQDDRGRFYQNFALGLLADPGCVGWQWHRYADNDAAAEGADASNLDSNKGLVSNRYIPWLPLVDAMTSLNLRTHGLITHPAAAAGP